MSGLIYRSSPFFDQFLFEIFRTFYFFRRLNFVDILTSLDFLEEWAYRNYSLTPNLGVNGLIGTQQTFFRASNYCHPLLIAKHIMRLTLSVCPVFLFLFGGFIKSGKKDRKPRISTYFSQLSTPSFPDTAWFITFSAEFLLIFFS